VGLFDEWLQEESLNKLPYSKAEILSLEDAFNAGMLAAADLAENYEIIVSRGGVADSADLAVAIRKAAKKI